MRLNKLLADSGLASRRQADLMIAAGRVQVNGVVHTAMGFQVDPELDEVMVDGKLLPKKQSFEYLIMNKPAGYLTTVRDPFGRPTVMDLLSDCKTRVYPVGRLDLNTSGLLFFTNDGDLALALTHPRHWVEKVYLARVRGIPAPERILQLTRGILLEDGLTAPAKVKIEGKENGNAIVRLAIREGRKRQVKRMLQAIGHPVLALHRLAMGPLSLGTLETGAVRRPTGKEMAELMKLKEKLNTIKVEGQSNVGKSQN